MSVTTTMRQLTQALVLGADRSPRPDISTDAALHTLAANSDDLSAWLDSVATLTLYESHGRNPATLDATIAPCHDGDVQYCSPGAAMVLERILFGDATSLLEEWCTLCAAAGLVAPPEYAMKLMYVAYNVRDDVRPMVFAAAGPRGRWMADLQKAFKRDTANAVLDDADAGDDPATIWQTAGAHTRLNLFRQLRESDPAAARELLLGSWAAESPDDRTRFIAQLRVGLSLDDEPLLEQGLDDKRKPVRQEAAELLTMLPGSAYQSRMTQRATAAVTLAPAKGLLKRKPTLAVTLPDAPDAAAKRDGLEDRQQAGLGGRAVMLRDIVAATPLSTWSAVTPTAAVEIIAESEWSAALLQGLASAAVRQRHSAWAEAILLGFIAKLDDNKHFQWRETAQQLLAIVEPARREAIVLSQLKSLSLPDALEWLEALPGPWSPAASRRILADIKSFYTKLCESPNPNADWQLRSWLREALPLRMDLAVSDDAGKGWPTGHPGWSHQLNEMIMQIDETLRLRRLIHKEFAT